MDPDHLRQFVEQTRQERVIDLQILSKRLSRLVCRIETLTGVFAVKADEQVDAFRPEIEALNCLVDHAFPVQTPVGGMPGPPAVLMLPWSEGVSLNGHTSPQALRQVGALLARLHRLPGTRLPPEGQTWAAWMLGWLRHALAYWQGSGAAPQDVHDRLARWFDHLDPFLERRGGQLILFDGRPEHFLVTPTGEINLIDVAELRAGDRLMDLAVLGLHEPLCLPGVLEAYGPLTPDEHQLLPFYTLLRALAAAEWDETELGGRRRSGFLSIAERALP